MREVEKKRGVENHQSEGGRKEGRKKGRKEGGKEGRRGN